MPKTSESTSAMNLVGTMSASSGATDRIHLSGVTTDTGGTVTLDIEIPFGLVKTAQETAAPKQKNTRKNAAPKRHIGTIHAEIPDGKGETGEVPLP